MVQVGPDGTKIKGDFYIQKPGKVRFEYDDPSPIALIADEVCEAARDGRPYAEVEALGYTVLTEDDVLDGVSGLVPRVEVEALFDDGMRLVVLHEPLASGAPPAARE